MIVLSFLPLSRTVPLLPPVVSYTNESLCFWSEPGAVVAYFLVNVTDASGNRMIFFTNSTTPQCLDVMFDPDPCWPLTVSVTAVNEIGHFTTTEHKNCSDENQGQPPTCRLLYRNDPQNIYKYESHQYSNLPHCPTLHN